LIKKFLSKKLKNSLKKAGKNIKKETSEKLLNSRPLMNQFVDFINNLRDLGPGQ